MSRVLLIYTGGTIGMVQNPKTGAHEPLNFEHLMSHVPELAELKVAVSTTQFCKPIDSSNMNPQHWCDIARIIVDNYDSYEGFVVLHGTDTMAYTASALSYMLENLDKPVIFTGSQLPIGVLRTDGKENLISSIEIAAARDRAGFPMVPEVCVYFQTYLFRGNRSKKLSAEEFKAFRSPNYPQLANIGVHISYAHHHIHHPDRTLGLRPHFDFCSDVTFLKLFPGITPQTVHAILSIPNLKGVVLESYGAGNAMTEEWFLQEIREAVARGIVIVNVSQCATGMVEMSIYDTGNQLIEAGVVSGGDLTAEAAVTKLMFLLGEGHTPKQVGDLMLVPIAGEVSPTQSENLKPRL
ncbi:MAG: asparaginase [Bacteroidales bacterium]|nr:asparaginase [Bacteroidales bacterium]